MSELLCVCGHAENCHGETDENPPFWVCMHGLPEDEWGGALLPEEIESGQCLYDGRPWAEPCDCRDYREGTAMDEKVVTPAMWEAAGQERLL